MKTFVLLTIGFTPPTPAIMDAWMQWFQSIADKIVDQTGLRNGKEVTAHGDTNLPMDRNAITGYVVIHAENRDEAIEIAQSCPMITSTRVYEALSPDS
jgi:hypothetical protein